MASTTNKDVRAVEFTLEGVNGIKDRRTFRIVRGVINRITGPNGSGKTSAMAAMMRYMGDSRAKVEVNDASDVGTVEGPGPTLTVAGKTRMKGEAYIPLADRAGALVRLITGEGRVGERERNNARIKALAELVPVAPDPEALCGDQVDLLEWCHRMVGAGAADDLFTLAALLKPEVDERARKAERLADASRGTIEATERMIDDIKAEAAGQGLTFLPDEDPADTDEAQAECRRATAAFERSKTSAEAREAHLLQVQEIRAKIGPQPSTAKAEAEVAEAEGKRDEIEDKILALKAQLQELELEKRTASERLEFARARHREVAQKVDEWTEQKALLDKKVEGATESDVLKAEMELNVAEGRLEACRLTRRYRLAQEELRQAQEAMDAEDLRARSLRDLAKSMPARLGDALEDSGIGHIVSVVNGRLAWRPAPDAEWLDWDDRMSSGQRIRAAFQLAARQFDGFVFVPADEGSALFLLLDPEAQKEIENVVKEEDLFFVTEQPAGGELRVEHGGEVSS